MVNIVLVGIGAGVAAALLFMAPIGGTLLAFPLFILTGLPLGIAGLGWGVAAAGIAALSGAAVVTIALSALSAGVFLLLFGLPVAWLTRLALMWRPADGAAPDGPRQWYPLGRLLAQAAAAVAVAIVALGFLLGFEPASLTRDISASIVKWMGEMPTADGQPITTADVEPFVHLNVAAVPFTATLILLVTLVVDLWLAAIVARTSGKLQRPAEKLWTVELPREVMIAFGIAVVLAFMPGGLGETGKALVGAFGGATALTGLAVLHAVTLGMGGRTILLVITYVVLALSGLPLILFALAGIAETFLNLRARRSRSTPNS